MRLLIIGSEYAGKTTLAEGIVGWIKENTGKAQLGVHDHFVVPYVENAGPHQEEEADQIAALKPSLLEKFMRYINAYHFHPDFYLDDDYLLVNWYYGDAVYAPLYYGYGEPGAYGDRRRAARHQDSQLMKTAPDTVLVLVKASPDAIRQRMQENLHPRSLLKDQDVEFVLGRFEEEHTLSILRRKLMVDTTGKSPAESLQDFLRQMESHLTAEDRLRILSHRALQQVKA